MSQPTLDVFASNLRMWRAVLEKMPGFEAVFKVLLARLSKANRHWDGLELAVHPLDFGFGHLRLFARSGHGPNHNMEITMLKLARYAIIAIAILAFPGYALWIGGGWIADRRAQRRHQ